MADVTLETLHADLVRLHSEMQTRFSEMQTRFSSLEARVIGLPIIGESIAVLQRNVRMLTAAINDMARVNITAGEVEALHTELEQLAAKQNEIEAQLLQTRERLDRLEQRGMP
jgi:chromosome segregation ATPase